DRLGQEYVDANLGAAALLFFPGVSADENDWQVARLPPGPDPRRRVEPAHARQQPVKNHEPKRVVSARTVLAVKQLERLLGGLHADAGNPEILEKRFEQFPTAIGVLDQEHFPFTQTWREGGCWHGLHGLRPQPSAEVEGRSPAWLA